LRTTNLYPISAYVEKIAEAVTDLYKAEGDQSTEIFFNDIDLVLPEESKEAPIEDIKPEDEELDELLTEDVDENLSDDLAIKKIKSAIKVSDDDATPGDTDAD